MDSKLFDNVRKNKVEKNVNKDSAKLSSGRVYTLCKPYTICNYCQKVFCHSKFLVKHLLRRHCDELILFFKNCTDREINKSDLAGILKKEFLFLKEFNSAKISADGKHESEKGQSIEEKKDGYNTERNQNTSCSIALSEMRDLKKKILDVEKDIHNLNVKFMKMDNVLENEVSTKKYVSEKLAVSENKIVQSQESKFIQLREVFLSELNEQLALSENRIIQSQESKFIELREVLLSELKSLLHNQQETISSECKSQLLELKHEIKRLGNILNALQQPTSTDSLNKEIKNELMALFVPQLHSKNCERKKLKHLSSETEIAVNKSLLISPSQMSTQENSSCKKSNSRCFRKQSEKTLKYDVQLTSLVAEKNSQFSIAPNISTISDADFSEKKKLLNAEKDRLSKKYPKFKNTYSKLNEIAEQNTLNKLKNKKHKIKFAESSTSSRNNSHLSSFEDSAHESSFASENRNNQFNCTEKTSDTRDSKKETHLALQNTSFTSTDKGACGDSFLSFSNEHYLPKKRTKLTSIQEEYETSDFDVENSKSSTVSSSKDSKQLFETEQNIKSISAFSPNEQGKLNHITNFTSPNKSGSGDSVLIKQNVPMKHAKLSSSDKLTSSALRNIQDTENLNSTFTITHRSSASEELPECKRQSDFVVNSSHSVQIKGTTKTFDKLSELEDYNKFDGDFDDVSSLETLSDYENYSDDL